MKNTNPKLQEEPVIQLDEQHVDRDYHQHKKHLTLLKVFIVFAVLAVAVILILWWTHRGAMTQTGQGDVLDELDATSNQSVPSAERRSLELQSLSAQSQAVTEGRDERTQDLQSLHNAQ